MFVALRERLTSIADAKAAFALDKFATSLFASAVVITAAISPVYVWQLLEQAPLGLVAVADTEAFVLELEVLL
jgi:hypothetical protein